MNECYFTINSGHIRGITIGKLPFQAAEDHNVVMDFDTYLTSEMIPSEASGFAVNILGWIVHLLLEKENSLHTLTSVHEWVQVLRRCSEENQSVLMRTGAVESLLLSRALHTCQIWLDNPHKDLCFKAGDISLQCWLIALRLMQDDDEDIRAVALNIVVACVPTR